MKTKLKTSDGCKRCLTIEVPETVVNGAFDQVYKDIGKTAIIPGFRKGKVPRSLLEKNYRHEAREEVIKRLVSRFYGEAIEELDLFPLGVPEITAVKLEPGKPLVFDASLEVKPEVKLKAYKGLKIKKKKVEVTGEDIKKTLEALRKMKANEAPGEKDNPVPGDKDKTKKEEPLPPLDDLFAKSMGYETLKELEEAVKKDLLSRRESESKMDVEKQILDQLLKTASLEAPDCLVESELAQLAERAKMQMLFGGTKKEDIVSEEEALKEKLRGNAIERVKVYFVLDKVAQLENITVTEEDINKRMEAIALRSGQSIDQVKEYIQKEGLGGKLRAEMRGDMAMQFLLKEAKQV